MKYLIGLCQEWPAFHRPPDFRLSSFSAECQLGGCTVLGSHPLLAPGVSILLLLLYCWKLSHLDSLWLNFHTMVLMLLEIANCLNSRLHFWEMRYHAMHYLWKHHTFLSIFGQNSQHPTRLIPKECTATTCFEQIFQKCAFSALCIFLHPKHRYFALKKANSPCWKAAWLIRGPRDCLARTEWWIAASAVSFWMASKDPWTSTGFLMSAVDFCGFLFFKLGHCFQIDHSGVHLHHTLALTWETPKYHLLI